MLKSILLAACAACLSITSMAQTIGTYLIWPNTSIDTQRVIFGAPPAARTYVNLSGPATADGTIRSVAFRTMTGNGCNDVVKVKFFRRTGDNISAFAESGPFPRTGIHTKVVLPTPVDVRAGDLVGITISGNCYQTVGPIGQVTKTEGTASINSDAPGPFDLYGVSTTPRPRLYPTVALGVFGSSSTDPEVRTQVIVAA